jgi:TPR repeat protein
LRRYLKNVLISICLCGSPGGLLAAGASLDPQTPAQMVALESRSANGDEKAQMQLALMYLKGEGVAADVDKALYYYHLVAERDIAVAQHRLARIYLDGTYVEPDPEIALAWLLRAADLGFVPAQLELSLLYENGVGMPPDLIESYKWFVIATSLTDQQLASRRDQLEARMTTIELAYGEMLARFCILGGYRDC